MSILSRQMAWGVSLLCALGVGAGVQWWWSSKKETQPPPLIALENMGHLVSVKVNFADVINFSLPRAVGIPMTPYEIRYGGTTVLLIAKGDCTVATDLRLGKYDAVDTDGRRLTILLPRPTTLSARVNHSSVRTGGSQLYAVTNDGLEAFIPDQSNRNEAIEKAFATAESRVAAACRSAEALATAKGNTEVLLRSMYSAIGWDVAIKWR